MKRIYLLLISLLSGVLLWAAWPARGFTPLIFVALVPLFWVEDYVLNRQQAQDGKKYHVFLYSFCAFLVWNVLATWWVWNATPAALFAFMANAALMASAFSLFHYTSRRLFKGNSRWFVLIAYWLGFESFHCHWDLNWPWLTLGNAFATVPSWVQWYEITGTLGGSVWVLVCNIALLYVLKDFLAGYKGGGPGGPHSIGARTSRSASFAEGAPFPFIRKHTIIAVCLILIPWAASLIRYATYKEKGRPVEVVVVQPNIDPYSEQFYQPPLAITLRMLNLADPLMTPQTRYIVTPESMIQENFWEDEMPDGSLSLDLVYKFLYHHPKTRFIAGISSYSKVAPCDSDAAAVRRLRYAVDSSKKFYRAHNSVISVGSDRHQPIPVHHKSRLTPGVEIMPYISTFKFLERWAVNLGGTVGTLGVEEKPYIFGGTKETGPHSDTTRYASIICYESVFWDYVAECVKAGAELLFISTNDGWWGNTPGYRQHAAYARLRAVENRRDVARSANTGTSCFIDQCGRVHQKTEYWVEAAIGQTLYANGNKTFYSRYGDILGRCSRVLSLFLLLLTFVFRLCRRGTRTGRSALPGRPDLPVRNHKDESEASEHHRG